jgi:hypothetical protein
MQYRELDWSTARTLTVNEGAEIIERISFNNATIYRLLTGDYLVMPLNPFGKCIIAPKKEVIDSFINDRYFPISEKQNQLFQTDQKKIIKIEQYKPKLKQEILDYLNYLESSIENTEVFDSFYSTLKKKKVFERFKLSFIYLLGDWLIGRDHRPITWGLLSNKQFLNPIISVALVIDNARGHYFDIQGAVENYATGSYVLHQFQRYQKTSNEIEELVIL